MPELPTSGGSLARRGSRGGASWSSAGHMCVSCNIWSGFNCLLSKPHFTQTNLLQKHRIRGILCRSLGSGWTTGLLRPDGSQDHQPHRPRSRRGTGTQRAGEDAGRTTPLVLSAEAETSRSRTRSAPPRDGGRVLFPRWLRGRSLHSPPSAGGTLGGTSNPDGRTRGPQPAPSVRWVRSLALCRQRLGSFR